MPKQIFTAEYNANNHMITLVEHDTRPWLIWSTIVGKPGLGNLPSQASLPVMAETMGGLGNGIVKALAPRSNGTIALSWLISKEAVLEILVGRDPENAHMIFDEIGTAFALFEIERENNKKDLPGSGESETSSSTSSPQVPNDEEVDDSPEQEGLSDEKKYPETVAELGKMFDESMGELVKSMSNSFDLRLEELEMVKYADQLGDMAERVSSFEEKLYSYESELRDFKLLIRSLKDATGSQVQAETIAKLVGMLDKPVN